MVKRTGWFLFTSEHWKFRRVSICFKEIVLQTSDLVYRAKADGRQRVFWRFPQLRALHWRLFPSGVIGHPICVTIAAQLNIIRLLTYNLAGPRPRKNTLETRLHWFSILSAKSTAKIVSGQNTCYYIHSSYRPSLYGWRGLGENEVEGT